MPFNQFINFSRQFVFGVLILSLLSCGGSGSSRTTSLANLETQRLNEIISGSVQLGTSSHSSSVLLSLSSTQTDQIQINNLTARLFLARNSMLCGESSLSFNGQYSIVLSEDCQSSINNGDVFKLEVSSNSMDQTTQQLVYASRYTSLQSVQRNVVDVTPRTTQMASLIDYQLLSTGLQSSNRSQMATLADTEFDELESILRNSIHSFETLDLSSNCQLARTIDSPAFADSLSNCLIVECFQNLLRTTPSISGMIESVYENNSKVANTLFNNLIQLMEEDGLISSDFRLKFGLDLTTDQCRSSQLSVDVPDQISKIKGAVIGQGADLSGLPESTVLEKPFFIGFDLKELTVVVNNPVFVYVINGDDFDTSLVSGSVTTTEDNPANRPYCYEDDIQCYESQDVSGNYFVDSKIELTVFGCMDPTACNYDPYAQIQIGETCSYRNSQGVCNICEEDEYVLNNTCVACLPGYENEYGDDANGGNTDCEVTYCSENEYVLNNICESCAPGTTNASGDNANGGNTGCDVTYCSENEYVSSNTCLACASGTTNNSGDDASGGDTFCDSSCLLYSDFDFNSGNQGNMWDIVAFKDLTINSIGFNFNGCLDPFHTIRLYKRTDFGSHEDVEFDSSAWEVIFDSQIECNGSLSPSSVINGLNVVVPEGERQAFYLYGVNRSLVADWNVGSSGTLHYSIPGYMNVYVGSPLPGLFTTGYSGYSAAPSISIGFCESD